MKAFALFVGILAIISSVMALKNDVCGLPHSGDGFPNGTKCTRILRYWTYKQDTNKCIRFTYGGCGGNNNRFDTKRDCKAKCKE